AVADEDVLGGRIEHAPLLLLHHDGFPGRENALLIAVAFGRGEVLDHREAHRLRCAEAESAGVADIERDDLVALALELERTAGEPTANLVADAFEVRARLQCVCGA